MKYKGDDGIMQDLFSDNTPSVESERILYTPSTFARSSLLHLQEVGSLKAISAHTSSRKDLVSFLCFVVLDGCGELAYEGNTYFLKKGDCVFIDCRKAYSHRTGVADSADTEKINKLWSLQWCHFYAPFLPAVYEKYKERGGRPVFHPKNLAKFRELFSEVYLLASSSDYIRDMRLNEKLSMLLTMLMEESWHPEDSMVSKKRMELTKLKEYLDEHYTEKISLDELAIHFFINKYYLTKIFKETYGTTINSYIIAKRITRAKQICSFITVAITAYFKSFDLKSLEKQHKDAANQFIGIRNELRQIIADIHMSNRAISDIESDYKEIMNRLNRSVLSSYKYPLFKKHIIFMVICSKTRHRENISSKLHWLHLLHS